MQDKIDYHIQQVTSLILIHLGTRLNYSIILGDYIPLFGVITLFLNFD